MAIGINGTPGAPTTFGGGTTHTHSYTIAGGARRKAIMHVNYKTTTQSINTPLFNGNAMTTLLAPTPLASDGGIVSAMYYYDIPDGLGDGAYNFSITTTASTANGTVYGWVLSDATSGAPTDSDSNDAVDPDAVAEILLTNAAGAFILAAMANTANGQTHTWTNDVTERHDTAWGAGRTTSADGVDATGNATVTCTASGTTNSRQMIAAAFIEDLGASTSGAFGGLAGHGGLAGPGGLAGIGGGLAGFVKLGNIYRSKRWLWLPRGLAPQGI